MPIFWKTGNNRVFNFFDFLIYNNWALCGLDLILERGFHLKGSKKTMLDHLKAELLQFFKKMQLFLLICMIVAIGVGV
jgi:hypothetical protein